MSWKVGIWKERVCDGGDGGVWMRTDVENGFSNGWLGNTEEEFKKC